MGTLCRGQSSYTEQVYSEEQGVAGGGATRIGVGMTEDNILRGDQTALRTMQEQVSELERCRSKAAARSEDAQRLEKAVKAKEKEITDQIVDTTKKRMEAICASFDSETDKIKARQKKTALRKKKSKSEMIEDRVKIETSGLQEEYRQLKLETKSVFKKNHVPSRYNTSFYFALFLPRSVTDVLLIIITVLLTMLIVPCVVFFLLLKSTSILIFALVYFCTAVFFGGLYLLISNKTKEKHREVFAQVRELRTEMRKNKKKQKAKSREVRRDGDESKYELKEFDEEINELDRSLAEVVEQKKEALREFEQNTRLVLEQEIRETHKEALMDIKQQYDTAYREQKEAEERAKVLSLEVSRKYEAFLGKEAVSLDVIDAMLEKMEFYGARTIAEAYEAVKLDREQKGRQELAEKPAERADS